MADRPRPEQHRRSRPSFDYASAGPVVRLSVVPSHPPAILPRARVRTSHSKSRLATAAGSLAPASGGTRGTRCAGSRGRAACGAASAGRVAVAWQREHGVATLVAVACKPATGATSGAARTVRVDRGGEGGVEHGRSDGVGLAGRHGQLDDAPPVAQGPSPPLPAATPHGLAPARQEHLRVRACDARLGAGARVGGPRPSPLPGQRPQGAPPQGAPLQAVAQAAE